MPKHKDVQQEGLTTAHLWSYMAAILLLPVIVLWHQDNALYSPAYYADPWFYLGFFRNLLAYKRDLFYGSYYGSRLSWILPGALVHSLLPPLAANLVLHLAVQWTATVSLFATLFPVAGIRSAFLATLVFSANPWLWVATGWDYPDGAGIAYCLLTMALLTRSAIHPARKWSLVFAGATLAAMVYTHVFLATLTPLLVLYYLGLDWVWNHVSVPRAIVRFCLLAVPAFLGITILCGVANYFMDGNFWFYAPSIAQARDLAKNFRFARSIWFDHELAPWLWPSLAGSLTAIALLPVRWKTRSSGANAACILLSAQLLLAVAYMVCLQARGTTVLGHYPYVSYLLPFAFLVMGVSFWPAVDTMSIGAYLLVCSLALVTLGVVWSRAYSNWMLQLHAAQLPAGFAAAVLLSAALLLRRRTAGALLAVAGFSTFTAVALAQTVRFDGIDLHGDRAQYERVLHDRDRIEEVRKGRRVLFWFDRQEPDFHEYAGLNALYLAEFSQIGTSFPRGCEAPVLEGNLIVVASQRDGAAELARAALTDCWHQWGMRPAIEAEAAVARPGGPYSLALLGVQADISADPPLRTIPLEAVQLAYHEASIDRKPDGLAVTTSSGLGAFAARAPLNLDSGLHERLAVRVRVRVLQGSIGVGVLDPSGKAFFQQRIATRFPAITDAIVPLPVPPVTGDLVISNRAQDQTRSKAIIEKIEIRRMR